MLNFKPKTNVELKAITIKVVFVLLLAALLMVEEDGPVGPYQSKGSSGTTDIQKTETAIEKSSHFKLFTLMNQLKKPDEKFFDFYETKKVHGKVIPGIYNAIESHYGLPENVLFNQLMKESRGRCPLRANRAGAVGCFQFLDHTAMEFGLLNDAGDFRSNLYASAEASARYLVWLTMLIFGEDADPGDWEQLRYSLAAFNAGHKNVKRSGRVRIPNFSETLEYVHDIESLAKRESAWVYPGDTIKKISERVQVSPEEILRGNPNVVDDQSLKAHTVISLPNPKTGLSKLLVKKGMTLYRLQMNTGGHASFIKQANNMGEKDTLYAGAILNIPTR